MNGFNLVYFLFQVVQGKLAEEKEHGVGGGTMPRKLIDLGPNNGTAEVDDQVSNSSSDERTRSSTPQNINKTDHQKDKKLDSDPDHHSELQEWDPSKLQKLNPSNATDQATMSPCLSPCPIRSPHGAHQLIRN